MNNDQLSYRISNLTDEEILKMVNEKADDYTETALKIAYEEMDKRGLKRKTVVKSDESTKKRTNQKHLDEKITSFFSKNKNPGCLPIIIFLLVIGFVSQCGKDADQSEHSTAPTPAIEDTHQQTEKENPIKYRIDFSGRFNPTILSVGEKLVIEFTLKNICDQTIDGFKIAGHGPFKKFTIVNVMPAASYAEIWGTYWFESQLVIPPGELRALSIIAYPNEPGNFKFGFTPYDAGGNMIGDKNGEFLNIGGEVAVIR